MTTILDALELAKEYKENGVISTSAKALIVLADELMRLQEEKLDSIWEAKVNDKG